MNLPREILERSVDYHEREPWEKSRSAGFDDGKAFLGASEIAQACGLSKYAKGTPLNLWLRHTGQAEPRDIGKEPWLDWGHRLEPVVMARWQEDHRDLWVQSHHPYRVTHHPVYPRLRGTPDGLCTDDDLNLVLGLDAKIVRASMRNKFGSGGDDVSDDWLIQGLAYCEIFDVPEWHFAVLFGNSEYVPFVVPRNTEVIEPLIIHALDFMAEYVDGKKRPPIDGSDECKKYLQRAYGGGDLIHAVEQDVVNLDRLRDVKEQVKTSKAEEQLLSNYFKARCLDGNADGIEGVCTNKQSKDGHKVDWEQVACDLAGRIKDIDVYADILESNTTDKIGARTLRLATKKKRRTR